MPNPMQALRGLLLAASCAVASAPCLAADAKDASNADDAARLDAAVQYVKRFLKTDADPRWGGRRQNYVAPRPDEPVYDCDFTSIVRAIQQRGPATFEDANHAIVKVPVVAELLLLRDVGVDGGPGVDGDDRDGKPGAISCTFEYERYDFKTGTFARVPHFREQTFNLSFMSWGESREQWRRPENPLTPEWRTRQIAVAPENRYVRFTMRINVAGDTPYRTWPQVPRHLFARDELARQDAVIRDYSQHLVFRTTDLEAGATGPALERQLQRIKGQLDDREWISEKINLNLAILGKTLPFSEIKP